jgi:hypothetical protein
MGSEDGPTFARMLRRVSSVLRARGVGAVAHPGWWFVGEMTALPQVDASYHFALASHALEHTANPLQALPELQRVLVDRGTLVAVLPDQRRTFDHRRPLTTLAHLRQDYARGATEDDATHCEEIVPLHDLRRDPAAPQSVAGLRARCDRNVENRCMHHHVFDGALVRAMLTEAGFRVLDSETRWPDHLICLAERV